MAQKTVKKAAVKPAAKKVAAKPAAKKAPAKKTATKASAAMEPKATMAATHECGCGANCGCAKKCGCGSRGGRFFKKLILVLVIFALGFVAARVSCHCCKKGPHHNGPRVEFVNNCLDAASVKCPKLAEALPAMDINQDGCITREEYAAVKKHMRREIRDMQVEIAE